MLIVILAILSGLVGVVIGELLHKKEGNYE